MAYFTAKIPLNAPLAGTTFGAAVDISPYAAFSIYADTSAFVASYVPALYADIADATSNNYSGGFNSFSGSAVQDFNCGGAAHGCFRALRLYCSSYTSGTPGFWLVGRYL